MVGLGLGPVSVHMDPCPFIESEKGDSLVLLPNLLLPEDLVEGTLLFSETPIQFSVMCIMKASTTILTASDIPMKSWAERSTSIATTASCKYPDHSNLSER